MLIEIGAFGQVTDLTPGFSGMSFVAGDTDAARNRTPQTRDQMNQRCFSGTIGTQKAENRSVWNFKVYRMKDLGLVHPEAGSKGLIDLFDRKNAGLVVMSSPCHQSSIPIPRAREC